MQISCALRKATELSIGLTVIATLILGGCSKSASNAINNAASSAASSTNAVVDSVSATITPFKGPFAEGATVTLKDANGAPVALLSGGSINASGVASVSFASGVAYPLIVEVTGSYYNENTGALETSAVPVRSLIQNAAEAASGVPVTIVTETAVADLETRLGGFAATHPIQPASAVVALSAAGTMLGVPATALPTFDPVTHQTSDANTLRLAAWAVAANGQTGSTLAEKVKTMAAGMVNPANAPTSVISQATYDAALSTVSTGMWKSDAGAAPSAPTIPSSSYSTLYASAGAAGGTSAADSACKASGGMWDPFISVCLPAGGSTSGGTAGSTSGSTSGGSAGSGGTTTSSSATVPAVPTGVTATAISSGQIDLSWTAATGASAYHVYRATTAGLAVASMVDVTSGSSLVGPSTVATSLSDTYSLAAGTTYYYKVVALNGTGASVASSEASATTSAAATVITTAPAAPTGLTPTVISATQINLSWTAVAGATKYNIYKARSAGVAISAANKINTSNVTATAFNSTGLFGATPYYYVVTAENATGESIGSAEVTATTSAVPAGVTVPTTSYALQQNSNLQLASFNTVLNPPLPGQIRIFSAAAAASDTINIYRSTSPNVAISPANLITPVPINTKTVSGAGSWWFSFDDTGLAAGTKYYYRATLVNAAGEGPGSTEMLGRTPLATIGSGAGLTLSAAFKGKTTIPNVIPYESSTSPSFSSYFSDVPSRGFTVSYRFDAINGDLLEFGLIDTVGGTDNLQMDVTSAVKKCAITTATGYTACSALGVTFDRAAGSITFVSTPMKSTAGATIGSMLNITGTLNFTPF